MERNNRTMNDGDDIADAKFIPFNINGSIYNVNREVSEDLLVLDKFDDLIPEYDSEVNNFPFIRIRREAKEKIVPLNDYVTSKITVPNAQTIDDDTYYRRYTDKRQKIAEHLITQTYAKGFETPSPVQAISIPELVLGRDCLVQSKSGTGKTHAFLLGLLWHFDPNDARLQHIFITATHEVAVQIYDQVLEMLPPGTNTALCIGRKNNEQKFSQGYNPTIRTSDISRTHRVPLSQEKSQVMQAQVIVGTMGKIYDYICTRQWVSLKDLKSICIDEFDTIVTSRPRSSTVKSTEDQIFDIISLIPADAGTQRAFFSATINVRALKMSCKYFRRYNPYIGEPFLALLDSDDYTLDGIRQYYVVCNSYEIKKEVLIDLISQCRIAQGIIFANKIETANDLKEMFDNQEIPISSAVFHSGLSSERRHEVHEDLKNNRTRLLISTDITARGLDLQSVNVVFNFDMPDTLETYIHRVGRSGRHGRKGVAISLILVNKLKNIDEMQKVYGIDKCSKNSKMTPLPGDLGELL